MITAAGIALTSPTNKILFVRRSQTSTFPGSWTFPGCGIELSETPAQAAIREVEEETGFAVETPLSFLMNTPIIASPLAMVPGADVVSPPLPESASAANSYCTYITQIDELFEPDLGDGSENDGYIWASPLSPPSPLHPSMEPVIARLNMDELGIARAMAAGTLSSPQRYLNVTLWAMRITGTGVAYRRGHDEFVFRDPRIYMNQEFLDRCYGLSVIMEHPEGTTLNSEEFADRAIGQIVLPYLLAEANEVWGIAKVYDDVANELIAKDNLSTSPAVVFRDPNVNEKIELSNGKTLLIEGVPSLLDHLAICPAGVWDKAEVPNGILTGNQNGDLTMTEEEKIAAEAAAKEKADAEARKDADGGDKLDKILECMDSMGKRMDAIEARDDKSRKDASEEEAAKAKADADEAEEKERKDAEDKLTEEERADKKKADAEIEADKARKDADEKAEAERKEIKDSIARVASMIPKEIGDAEYKEMADAQEKADSVFHVFGESAPRPLNGEDLSGYRRRMASKLQAKCGDDKLKSINLLNIGDSASFDMVEERIYADSMAVAMNPTLIPHDVLREVTRPDVTGRRITSFYGKPGSWMRNFSSTPQRLTGIVKNPAA